MTFVTAHTAEDLEMGNCKEYGKSFFQKYTLEEHKGLHEMI